MQSHTRARGGRAEVNSAVGCSEGPAPSLAIFHHVFPVLSPPLTSLFQRGGCSECLTVLVAKTTTGCLVAFGLPSEAARRNLGVEKGSDNHRHPISSFPLKPRCQ